SPSVQSVAELAVSSASSTPPFLLPNFLRVHGEELSGHGSHGSFCLSIPDRPATYESPAFGPDACRGHQVPDGRWLAAAERVECPLRRGLAVPGPCYRADERHG